MSSDPVISQLWKIEIIKKDQVFLLNTKGRKLIFKGALFCDLLKGLLKKKPLQSLVQTLANSFPEEEIFHALSELKKEGIIEGVSDAHRLTLYSYGRSLNTAPHKIASQIANTSFEVVSLGVPNAHKLKKMLLEVGLIKPKHAVTHQIILAHHYRDPLLKKSLDRLLTANSSVMIAKPTGHELWIGPVFYPGKSPCFDCLLEKLEQNQVEERYIEKKLKKKRPFFPPTIQLPFFFDLALQLIANEAVKWVLQESDHLEGKLFTLDLSELSLKEHLFFARPNCSCAFLADRCFEKEAPQFEFQAGLKIASEDGGYRTVPPEQTLDRFRHLLSPITGIVSSIRHSKHNAHLNLSVFAAASSCPSLSLKKQIHQLHFFCVGKGKSEAQAQVSCLAEVAERRSGVFHAAVLRKWAKYRDLSSDALHPNHMSLYSQNQYLKRKAWNQQYGQDPFHIPLPFCEEKPIEWTPVWSLKEQRVKWAATALCYGGYPADFGSADFNGCAAGNTKEEAILQALFELIERDHIAIWWYNCLQRPEVDWRSFNDPSIFQTVQYYKRLERDIWVLDLTFDLSVSTFGVFSKNKEGKEILFGFGSHFNPEIALLRALSEMHQFFDYLEMKKTHPQLRPADLKNRLLWNWLDHAEIEQNPFFKPNCEPKKKKSDYPFTDFHDLKEDLLFAKEILFSKGLDILLLDQTRTDLQFPVFRVIVPGLRPKRSRFAEGRLYDVPFDLNLVKQKKSEQELNRELLFF